MLFSKNLSIKFKFRWNPTRIMSALHEDVFTFITVSRWILPRIRTVLNKSCRKNQNTHFVFSNLTHAHTSKSSSRVTSCTAWNVLIPDLFAGAVKHFAFLFALNRFCYVPRTHERDRYYKCVVQTVNKWSCTSPPICLVMTCTGTTVRWILPVRVFQVPAALHFPHSQWPLRHFRWKYRLPPLVVVVVVIIIIIIMAVDMVWKTQPNSSETSEFERLHVRHPLRGHQRVERGM